MPSSFSGVFTAMITPFLDNLEIDFNSLGKLIERQCKAKVSGIVVCGSTAEATSLTDEEFSTIIKFAKDIIPSEQKLIVGLATNSTSIAINRSCIAQNLGADALLIVVPYYNKPNQECLKLHFDMIARSTTLPIILYNVPSRTGADITNDTVAYLANHCPNIVGIKDATGSLERCVMLKSLLPNNFSLISGEDTTIVPFCASGGCGVISVMSNIFPSEVKKVVDLANQQNYVQAIKQFLPMSNFSSLIFSVANPIPIKHILYKVGFCNPLLRPPLFKMEQIATKQQISCLEEELNKLNHLI